MNHLKRKSVVGLVGSILAILLLAFPVRAETKKRDDWHFQLAYYGWLSGQKGTVATVPGLPAAEVDLDFFDDIADNINGSFSMIGEARKGRYGIFADIAYSDVEDDDVTSGPFYSSLTSRTKNWMATVAGFYRIIEQDRGFLDGLVGLRYWSVDSSLKFGAGILPAIESSDREEWVDPIIGLKGLMPLGASNFFISSALIFGGGGVGSDFMWDGQINLGYQWTEAISTTIGYRYMDVDYDEDEFLYDISQDGPVLGLSWRF